MRKDVGVDGDAQRIGQLVWMFFLKIYDDKETEYELLDDTYRSPIPEALRWRNWAANPEGMTGDELLDFVNNRLFATLKNLQPAHDDRRGFVIKSVFEDAYNYMKSGHLMRQVINKIVEGLDFNKAQDRHLFGDLYEQILRDLQNAGNAGEYYTPRPVTQFMVDMVAPQLGEKILDPACGTGGFLTCAIETVRKHHVKTVEDEQVLQQSIYGVEKKPLPHLLCTTNMILHGLDVPTNVRHDNTLARPLRDYGPKDRVDVIVTNPPFGGMEEDGIENNFPANFRTRETADLFLVLIMHLLKDGGRAALVLPDGTLFGEGIKTRIKEQLLETCNLHTVVRLPKGVFNPYTGIKTNLLFFTKGTPTQDIWFYEHPYPPGVKSYNKTKPMRLEEFEAEKAWWNNRVENEYAWKVSAADIKARNYDLNCKNPHSPNAVFHDPDELLADYTALQRRITSTRDQLKEVLATALETQADPDASNADWQRLSANFAILFTTEASLETLKLTILQLAVMGKLVPQDPSDEPANELLSRIASEKARLMAEGKLKKDKVLLPVSEEEQPFGLPAGWVWSRLANIAHINPRNTADDSTEASFVPMAMIGSRFDGAHGQEIRKWGEIKQGFTHFAEGDVGVAKITPCFENSKACVFSHLNNGIGAGTTELHIVRPLDGTVASRYILAYLKAPIFLRVGESKMTGTAGQKRLPKDFLETNPFPLPPLTEQHRIVTKIDELMALCDRLQADLAEARTQQARLATTLIESALKAA